MEHEAYLNYLFIYLFERQRNRERQRLIESSHLLIYTLNTHKCQDCAGPKFGARNSTWVSHLNGGYPATWARICYVPESAFSRSHSLGVEPRYLVWEAGTLTISVNANLSAWFILFIFFYFIFLKEKRSSICWFIPQMLATVRFSSGWS